MLRLVSGHAIANRATEADIAFLRDRCSWLQGALTRGVPPQAVEDLVLEGQILRRWTSLLVPATPWSPATQLALEELYVLQARLTERLVRGGVGDISDTVEHLARAVWVDRLQRTTDAAVERLALG